MANAVTISGEATKACVEESPSLRRAKFRLNEVIIEFLRLGSSICLAHCPMQGPRHLPVQLRRFFPKFSESHLFLLYIARVHCPEL